MAVTQGIFQVTGVLVQEEGKVKHLTEMVDCQYIQAARLAARLYALTSILGTLHSSYAVPLSLVQDSIAHRVVPSACLDETHEDVSQGE